jgi:2',3'-cyclic-nucleotide 2'-phosphodiesterase (5'-nucleotidase family)
LLGYIRRDMRATAGLVAAALAAAAACSSGPPPPPGPRKPITKARGAVTITVIGTNDLHGALDRLPVFGGYLDNLRAVRAAEGGGVVLVDAGDMFQGTLESNINEGRYVVAAYNALGYTAATAGNHEFDFGPEGPATVAASVDDDPRGALKARAAEAKFPILTSNVLDAESGNRIKWPNMPPSTMATVAGVQIGIIGVTTEATPFTTMPANFVGLEMLAPAVAITTEAQRLRDAGAQIVIVAAHVGSRCKSLDNPTDLSSCDHDEELFHMVEAIPPGAIDVIVAGHTHAAMAHRLGDVAVIESYSNGRGFGRVDLRVNASGTVTAVTIAKPQDVCPLDADGNPVPARDCHDRSYEGKPVVANAAVKAIVEEAMVAAKQRADEPLGVELTATVLKAYDRECALGNLFTDLMLASHPKADVAMTNGGGLRADIPAGPLTYGRLFNANPFDNRFAIVRLTGRDLRRMVTNNLGSGSGIFSYAGVTVTATCNGAALDVKLTRASGKPVKDADPLVLVTSDFLASGGDGAIGRLKLPDGSVDFTNTIIRDAQADVLRQRGGTIDPAALYSASKRRLVYPGKRPVRCGKDAPVAPEEPD